MSAKLTKLEEKMLSFIGDYMRAHDGDGPTLKQIGNACGIKSPGTVHRYVKSLETKGRLVRGKHWRTILLPGAFPFLGTVR